LVPLILHDIPYIRNANIDLPIVHHNQSLLSIWKAGFYLCFLPEKAVQNGVQVLKPYHKVLVELGFKLVWHFDRPDHKRERYEHALEPDEGTLWVFLSTVGALTEWSIGYNSTNAADTIASSHGSHTPLGEFSVVLRKLMAKHAPKTAL